MITIATRKSPLAIKQAEIVKQLLLKHHPDLTIKFLPLSTTGDKITQKPLWIEGGKGLFIKELEAALLDNRADIAVHSLKDVPMDLPEGLILPVICQRTDPRDAFVSPRYTHFQALPQGANLGTSSLRRQCQIKALRPDLNVIALRGNVNTRLNKLMANEFDAIVLAAAGLHRLELKDAIRHTFTCNEILPAAGQGALGIECRANDKSTLALIASLNHLLSSHCVQAERAVVGKLCGNCRVPIAAYAQTDGNELSLKATVGHPQGTVMVTSQKKGPISQALDLGITVAKDLLRQGAGIILKEFNSTHS